MSKIFDTISIGSMPIKNRFVMPPMATNYATDDGYANDRLIAHYEARAKGGFGLIIQEFTGVDPSGKALSNQLALWDDSFIPNLKKITDAVHKYDSKIVVQIHHGGRQTVSAALNGNAPLAPSKIPCSYCNEMPDEMSVEQIYYLIEKFGDAALRGKKAGYDGVEIHGAHGYLICQFLSPHSNKRTDEFGGNFKGRLKFAEEVVKNVRNKVGDDYPIIFRLSLEEYVAGGLTVEQVCAIGRALEKQGVDGFDLSVCNYTSLHMMFASPAMTYGFQQSMVSRFKASVTVPIITVGRMIPEIGSDILEAGIADLIAFGRPALADPELPNKFAEGKEDEIIPCIYCLQSCIGYQSRPDKVQGCLANPLSGHECEYKLEPSEKAKKVIVVGAGPAGLYCAWMSAKRGHNVTLYEKQNYVGGQFHAASIPPTKHEISALLKYNLTMCKKYGVKVVLGKEVFAEDIISEKPDAVVIATGGVPAKPPIPGIDSKNVYTAIDVLEGRHLPGNNIVVAGGGMVGAETAHFLAEHLRCVTILEMTDSIAGDAELAVRRPLMRELKHHEVNLLTGSKITRITDNTVEYEKNGVASVISDVDTVVLALGVKSYNPLQDELKGIIDEIYVVGDASNPGQANKAIEGATRVALKI